LNKHYWYVLLTYIVMQFSGILGFPAIYWIGTHYFKVDPGNMKHIAEGYFVFISFTVALLIISFILKRQKKFNRLEEGTKSSVRASIVWAIAGIFIAYFSQVIAVGIESALGIKMGSDNTKTIIDMVDVAPIAVLAVALVGPILEEIVFRKVLFGTLYNWLPFWLSALISSLIFSIAHGEPEHLLIYAAMGFSFAFLYVKTKRIIVPIIAHVTMNTTVVLIQSVFGEKMENLRQNAEHIQGFIGGFFK
jgi:membrane protease YdiL (CAAX protease family)